MRGRKSLWFGLGILWLVDGLLQAQPAMFTRQFVHDVLTPATQGQPGWFAAIVALGIQLWQRHLVAFNAAAVAVQLVIAVLLLAGWNRWWGRAGLWLSIGWSAILWVLGEGLGGVLAGSPTVLSGAPGAAVVYLLSAIVLLLPGRCWAGGSVSVWSLKVVGLFWLLAAAAQALPAAGYFSADGLAGPFQNAAGVPQPAALAGPIEAMAGAAAAQPVLINALFVALMAVLGLGFLLGLRSRWLYGLTAAWLLFGWWLGQDFGAVFSGTGTDPNLAIPLGLLIFSLAAALPRRRRPAVPSLAHSPVDGISARRSHAA